MKGLDVLNKLGKSVNDYHQKGQQKFAHKQGPSGPEHKAEEGHSGASLDEHTDDQVHHTDMEQLEDVLCPGCHDRLRGHLVAKASGSKEPISDLE
jgi:hypothetical protein